jgi:hypothetical protein
LPSTYTSGGGQRRQISVCGGDGEGEGTATTAGGEGDGEGTATMVVTPAPGVPAGTATQLARATSGVCPRPQQKPLAVNWLARQHWPSAVGA